MAETDIASVITPSVSTAVTYAIAPVSESASGGQSFNGTYGFWLSDPLVLPGNPVTGSVVRWTATIPAGCTVAVETSINNGASWDTATSDLPVPRLREGDTATQTVLARITMTRPPPTLFPGSSVFPGAGLFPTGSGPKVSLFELAVSTDASVDEFVPVGHGMVDKVTVSAVGGTTGSGSSASGAVSSSAVISRGGGHTGGGTSIAVHVTDLSRAIKRNVWQMPYTIPSGMNYGDAAKAMVLDRLPSQTDFSIATTTRVTPLLVYGLQQGGDPWQDIQELAQAIGFEAFFDARGVFVFRPVPDPRHGEPVWEFDESANPLVVEAQRELSDEQTFNDIVVIGQSTSSKNPVSAEALDDDPSSPTYILGEYGRVTQRLTFNTIVTADQAQDAANAILYNSLGAAETVTITVVPMPALEPGDVVKLNVPEVGASGTFYINSMTTPLSPAEPQQLVCFRQSQNTQTFS